MFTESITDIRIAFKTYLEYKKEYILTFIIFLMGIFLLVFTGIFIFRFVILDNYFQFEEVIRVLLTLIILLILCSIFFLLLSYTRTIFGLSNDIITSGDLFTEFRRSISYFKKYWLYFALLTAPFGLIIFIEQLFSSFSLLEMIHSQEGNRIFFVGLKIIVYSFDLMLYIALIEIFPSLIEVKKLRQCIKENFSILRQNFKRVFVSVAFYYLIFRGPMFIVDITRILIVNSEEAFLLFNFIFLISSIFNVLIGLPILSLITTRIYNTTILKARTETSIKSAGLS
ncbi:MAG: hypothetical protein ACW964_02450 [Candidatus Hodarchaeales archaeon]|jgi:hypothetical protein